MAQLIKWWETHINYKEGPFVIAFNLAGNYWTVLCENPSFNDAVLPHKTIINLCESQKKKIYA